MSIEHPEKEETMGRYESIPFQDELFPIRILWDLCTKPKETQEKEPLWHEQLEILYITEGTLVCECDFRQYVCTTGDIVVINPYEAHTVKFYEETARYHCLMVDPRLYSGKEDISGVKYIRPMSERRVKFHHVIQKNERAHLILMELFREYRDAAPAFEIAVKGNLLRFLSELFRSEVWKDDSPRSRTKPVGIAPALHHIAEHYFEEITLDDLASVCFMNRSYFCRRFRIVTGDSPIAYLNHYRLTLASDLLKQTDLPVAKIAEQVGFCDPLYFSKLFHKTFRISPREYRKIVDK